MLQRPAAAVHCIVVCVEKWANVCWNESACVCVCVVNAFGSSGASGMTDCGCKCNWLQLNKTSWCMCETASDWGCVGVKKPLCISCSCSYNMLSQNYLFFFSHPPSYMHTLVHSNRHLWWQAKLYEKLLRQLVDWAGAFLPIRGVH